ncbi:MAG TPA: hypothetical protein PK798_15620 [Flavobacteriales bacterium]|nr:hypothetical protein [Flavobacteriales bacterium]HRJ36698.1 hypothetical protein [Flavobacteriales bacterium]HRJ40214.1 hypothetical protein [Flavobacteriales bacterium]
MRQLLTFSLISVILFSCSSEKKKANPVEVSDFISEKILIDLSYPPYQDTVIPQIMARLGLCELEGYSPLDTNKRAPCSHELFRVFMNHGNANWQDGFLVEVRPGVYSPEFRLLSIARVEGVYKVTNDYAGELLEMRTTPEGMYDLIIRYVDGVVGTVAIFHEWRTNHYEPITVVELNDHFVKEEKMDSLNSVYIGNFSWGF